MYKLIMLPNQPILISDEEIKEGFYKYCPFDDINKIHKQEGQYFDKHEYKIIAGIPELHSIDFSMLSEEDCKNIGWIDVEKLAKQLLPDDADWQRRFDVIKGFKAAQSLNEKKFSEEDIKEITYQAAQYGMWYALNSQHNNEVPKGNVLQWFQNRFAQPKIFDVLIETENSLKETMNSSIGSGSIDIITSFDEPKITNNSIKITKIL